MADKKISDFTAVTTLASGDLLEIETAGGNSRKVTVANAGLDSGTSFPGSPATGVKFWRSDRAIEYFYDGTRWLSTQLFTFGPFFPDTSAINPIISTQTRRAVNPWWGVYDIYVTTGTISSILTTGTTSANYFTGQFKKNDNTTATNIGGTLSTQNDTQNAHVGHSVTINEVISSGVEDFDITYTESGTASCYVTEILSYRLVG